MRMVRSQDTEASFRTATKEFKRMKCPECAGKMESKDTRVYYDAVNDFTYVQRRRVCAQCSHRMNTIELDQAKLIEFIGEPDE